MQSRWERPAWSANLQVRPCSEPEGSRSATLSASKADENRQMPGAGANSGRRADRVGLEPVRHRRGGAASFSSAAVGRLQCRAAAITASR
jgi:hypothetical protein